MAFYPKRLRTIDDLEREQKLLRKKKEEMEQLSFLSAGGGETTASSKKDSEQGGADKLNQLIELLPVIMAVAGPVIELVKNKFSGRSDKADERESEDDQEPGLLRNIATEVIGGYLKWKAIQLSYKGIRLIIKKRKAKKKKNKTGESD